MGAVVASAPTVGSNHEVYEYKGVRFGLIDLGGQSSLRQTWNQYFTGTTAIILVIDSNDAGRLALAKAELQKLVKAEVSCVMDWVGKEGGYACGGRGETKLCSEAGRCQVREQCAQSPTYGMRRAGNARDEGLPGMLSPPRRLAPVEPTDSVVVHEVIS